MKIINSIDILDVKVAKEFDKYAVDVSMESSIKDAVRSFQIGDIDAAHNFGRLEDTTDINYLDNLLLSVSSSSQGKKGETRMRLLHWLVKSVMQSNQVIFKRNCHGYRMLGLS
ncbi:hypothetical protein PO640_23610 [Citrobacter freundii]|uniref:hypothetical protein n=1 Tax=Citrobacter freundii TaxID=546 RepID=UPI002FF80821